MDNDSLSRNTYSFGISLAICAVLNAIVVIIKESGQGVADMMKKMTGHHWITHVAIILTLFFAGGLLLNRTQLINSPSRLIQVVAGGVAIGVLIILGFYVIAD